MIKYNICLLIVINDWGDSVIHKFKDELTKIQNEIVSISNLAIVVVDREGNYVTEKTNYSQFCKIFRNNKNLSSYCEKCDIQALNKAFLTLKPYIYRCHSGLIDIVVPIVYDGELIGAFLVGQVVLVEEKSFNIQQILNDNLGKNIDGEKLKETYKLLPRMTHSQLESLASIVSYISNYISGCIKNKKWNTSAIETNRLDTRICLNDSPIGAAIMYINKNLNNSPSLNEAASLCNMSVSQFTRTFKRETGKTFIDFVTRKKIKQAKYLLQYTNKTMNEIAFELGMDNSSYFTKVFKKYTGLRPKEYRNNISTK